MIDHLSRIFLTWINYPRRIVGGIAWSIVAAALAQSGTFVASVILARMLGRTAFGQYGLIQNTVVTFSNVAVLGLGITATRYVAHLRLTDPVRAGRVLGLCSIMASTSGALLGGALLATAQVIASEVFREPAMAGSIRLAAGFVFFNTLCAYQSGVLAGLEDFRRLAMVSALQSLLWIVGAAALTRLFSLDGTAGALAVVSLAQFVAGHILMRRSLNAAALRVDYTRAFSEASILRNFALPAAASGFTGGLAIWSVNTNIARHEGGFSEMAIVALGSTLRTVVLFGPTLVNRAVSPALTRIRASGGDYQSVHGFNLRAVAAASISLACLFTVLSGPILALYGSEYVLGRGVILLFVWSAVLEVVAGTLYQRLLVHGRMWWQLGINATWSALLVAIAISGAGVWGAGALAVGYIVAWSVSLLAYALIGRTFDAQTGGARVALGSDSISGK